MLLKILVGEFWLDSFKNKEIVSLKTLDGEFVGFKVGVSEVIDG